MAIEVRFKARVSENGFFKFPNSFKKHHCDMAQVRRCPRFGGIANSNLFEAALHRALRNDGVPFGMELSVRQLVPGHIDIEKEGYLTTFVIHVGDE